MQYSNKVIHEVRIMKQLTGHATPAEQLSEVGARNYAN